MVANLTVINNKPDEYGGRSFSPSSCNPNGACGNGLEKIYPTCAVRFGYMGYIGEFKYAPGMLFGCGAKVVIQTERGIEIGEQVSLTCTGCSKSVKRDTMLTYVKNSGQDFFRLKAGRILRLASPQDLEEERHLNLDLGNKIRRAREIASAKSLPMKFVACEHLFGGERVIYHFMSEGRVDFRDLVRDLAHEYHTRIEMHQVGARDEARLVADYEICGRECCCKNFLKTLRPVTMRMAKLQKATLDPSKVSGRCGRLRCCLRYEHDGYEELDKKLPKVGHRVRTDRGVGTIRDRQILTQLVTVSYDDSDFVETVGIETVLERHLPRLAPEMERRPDGPPDTRQGRHPPMRDDRRNRPPEQRERVEPPPVEIDEFPSEGDAPLNDVAPPAAPAGESPIQSPGSPPFPQQGHRRRRRRGRRGRLGGPEGGGPTGPQGGNPPRPQGGGPPGPPRDQPPPPKNQG